MDARFTVAQITGALPANGAPKPIKLEKPQTDQALTVHLDGNSKLDLTAITNENVTFVHVGDRLIILFDNHSTVAIEPFYDSKGLPLADISVELSPDRSISGAEFTSLFPVTTDQSILPAAGDTGAPPSGANFETVTVAPFTANPVPLALLPGPDAPAGNGGPSNAAVTTNLLTQGPTLGVHDVAGIEEKPIALGITDALGTASLGSLTITGVPAGATLSAGIHNADGSWTLTPAQLAGLTLTSDGEVQHFSLTVQATAIDGTITEVSTATFNVSVTPVADSLSLSLTGIVSGKEGEAIALPIQATLATLGEADADEVLTVTISGVPAGVTLSAGIHNADGSWMLKPAQLSGLTLTSDGEVQHFDLTVTATAVDGGSVATAASASATLHVNVAPVPETPTLDTIATPASINEGTTIALNLVAHFEADADATNTIVISGLPSGATLNHGTLDPNTGTYTLSVADLVGLTLTAPDDDTKQITFTVTAHASEGGIDAASSSQQVTLAVNPVAEAPTLAASAAAGSVNEEGTIALNIIVTPVSEPGENDTSTTVTISNLGTATLNHGTINSDGSVTLQLSDLAGLTLHAADDDTSQIHLTVTATTHDGTSSASTTQVIDLEVDGVADVGFISPVLAVSVDANGNPVGGGSADSIALDSNGAEVAFDVFSSTSNSAEVFAKNLQTGALTLVSADANGNAAVEVVGNTPVAALSFNVSIDGDGQLVAFESNATNLVPNLAANPLGTFEVFVKNIVTGQVVVASSDASGALLSGGGFNPVISADGITVTFQNGSELFQKNLATGALTLVSTNVNGNAANAAVSQGLVSGNGNLVVFASAATNLAANATDGKTEVFVKNLATGAVTLASANANGNEANAVANVATISADGRYVVFDSSATNLTANATDGKQEIFVKDLQTGAVTLVSADASGAEGTAENIGGSISADGRFVTFVTDSANLLSQPTGGFQIVTKDLLTGAVTLISADASGTAGNGISFGPVISADGRVVAADTQASNLGGNGSNQNQVFVKTTNVAFGAEDKPIAIPLQFLENDPDATTVILSGIPSGVTLSNAANNVPPIVNGSVTLTQAQLAGLALTSDGEVQAFDLVVSGVDGGVATVSTTVHVEVAPVPAASPTLTVALLPPAFTTIDAAISGTTVTSTQVTGINDAGHVVGLYRDAAGTHVFEDINGNFTPITLPGLSSSTTVAVGINSSDQVVGNFTVGAQQHGFIEINGNITQIDDPSAVNVTLATGINDSGEIVGLYRDASLKIHGFIDINGHFTTIDVPSSLQANVNNPETRAFGINNAGEVVGFFKDFTAKTHGFLDNNGKFTTIDAPGATLTEATGISNTGEIVGFFTDAAGKDHGFLDNNGKFTTIDVPGATLTHVLGINDNNQVFGFYTGADGVNHGFLLQQSRVFGNENAAIALPISAGLTPTTESDPDAKLTITISGLPSGVTLTDANHDVLTITNGSATLTQAQLNGLALIGDGGTQHFDLTVIATNTDGGNSLTAISTPAQVIHVDVAPVATPPAPAVSNVAVNEGGTAALSEQVSVVLAAWFDAVHDVWNLNNNTVQTNLVGEALQLTDAGHPGATLSASGNRFTANGANETLDLSGWDRAVEIDFVTGTIRLDANSLGSSGSFSGFANVLGTTHDDFFDNLTGGITLTGGTGTHFALAANALSSANSPTILNYSSGNGETIDLAALLDAKFGSGSDATKASSFVQVKEDAGGNSATLEINLGGKPGGTFVAAAHLGGIHSGDVVNAILDHAHTTAQLHAA